MSLHEVLTSSISSQPLHLNTLQSKRWFHYRAWDALSANLVFGKCFCLSAVSAAHLAELETTCHLRLLSSPWQSGANDLEGSTVPLHMGLAACVTLGVCVCVCVCVCVYLGGYIFVHLKMHFSVFVNLPESTPLLRFLDVCVCALIVCLCQCLSSCENSSLGPFRQRLESPRASGPVVLPASRVIRTGHADQ